MSEVKQKLFDNQAEAVKKQEVFSRVVTCQKKGDGTVSKELDAGIVFVGGNAKLMSKDGANNVLLAIGIEGYEGKVDSGANKFFRPTTFDELAVAFRYTEPRALESFFKSEDANNSNLNELICTFLKYNLESDSVDVKALAATSKQIKSILDDKSEQYYDEKVDFYAGKIEKYQGKIGTIRQEQSAFHPQSECSMGTALDSYIQELSPSTTQSQSVEVGVEQILEYINLNKEVLADKEIPVWDTKNQLPNQMVIEVQ